jgi:6-phosphofructokinase 1
MNDWMTKDEAAEYAKVSPRTIQRWISSHALPSARRGRVLRIRRADLDKFLQRFGDPANRPGRPEIRTYLSYAFEDEFFARRVNYFLRKQPSLETFFHADDREAQTFPQELGNQLASCDAAVFFQGRILGSFQKLEMEAARAFEKPRILVWLPGAETSAETFGIVGSLDPIALRDDGNAEAERCAREIVHRLGNEFGKESGITWVPDDDLPMGYPFSYEKDIIEEYVHGNGRLSIKRVEEGCPEVWPDVIKDHADISNPIPPQIIGAFRPETARIVVDARGRRIKNADGSDSQLTFPEAGPRDLLCYPRGRSLRVGILVSGGIAPGINAVIEGIVERHELYAGKHNFAARQSGRPGYRLEVLGYIGGLNALLHDGLRSNRELTLEDVRGNMHLGGSIIGTSRADELLDKDTVARRERLLHIVRTLERHALDILYVIGGDGSMRAAHAIWKTASSEGYDLSVVAIPKTMDNDILWVWQAFGFSSAVNKAEEVILQLHTETTSNPRLGIVQLFGSDSGFVVVHAALASGAGVCDAVLIPESCFSMRELSHHITSRLVTRLVERSPDRPHSMIIMAETAIPEDIRDYIDEDFVQLYDEEKSAIRAFLANNRRVYGQTPDALRTGGLKVVARVLEREIQALDDPYWGNFRVFTNEPRHLIRAMSPNVSDLVFGQRLGTLAVDNAMAGYTDFMVSQWLTEYVLVPLKLVVLGRKRVPKDGIFWKSVISNTGQPADMCKHENDDELGD